MQEGLTKKTEFFAALKNFVKLHPHREGSAQGIFHYPFRFPYQISLSKIFLLGGTGIYEGNNSLPYSIPLSDSPIEFYSNMFHVQTHDGSY